MENLAKTEGAHNAPSPWQRLVGIIDFVTAKLNLIGSFLILALMIFIGVDVAGRNLFNHPLSGVPEMVTLSILVIVFLQAPQALRQGRITRSDTLINILTKRAPNLGNTIETVFDALGFMVFAIIIYGTFPLLLKSWQRNEFIGAMGDFTAPVWPVKAAIIIGCTMLCLNFCLRIIQRWSKPHGTL